MINKIIKRLCSLFVMVVIVMTCVYPAGAYTESYYRTGKYKSTSYVFLKDESGLLTDSQIEKITGLLENASNRMNFNVSVLIGTSKKSSSVIRAIADDGAKVLINKDKCNGSVFLYIDMQEGGAGNDWISAYHDAALYFPKENFSNRCSSILSRIKEAFPQSRSQIKGNDLFKGLSNFCTELNYYYSSGPQEGSYYLNDVTFNVHYNGTAYKRNAGEYSVVSNGEIVSSTKKSVNNSTASTGNEDFLSGDYVKTNSIYFKDESKRFSAEEKTEITTMLSKTADDTGFHVALFTAGKSRSDSTVERLSKRGAEEIFDKKYNIGTVFLYVDLDGASNAYDYMYSYHDAFLYYTDEDFGDRVHMILHKMQEHFPKSGQAIKTADIIKGLNVYCDQLRYYKNQGPDSGAYYINDIDFTVTTKNGVEHRKKGEYTVAMNGTVVQSERRPYNNWYMFLGGGIIVSLIVIAITRAGIKKHYKFKTSTSASVYTSKNKMFMRDSQDIFIGKTVTKVNISSSSGGGHGGGGGGGHVGGGGGGSHR